MLARPACRLARHQCWISATVRAASPQRKMGRPKVDSVTKVWQRRGSKGAQVGSGGELVVAGDDPDFAVAFHANLGRAEDVSGGMEGDAHLSDADGGAVGFGLDGGLVADAGAQQGLSGKCGQVGSRSGACVVAMSVSNEGAIDGEGRVDMEISGGAVQSGFANLKERHMLIVLRLGTA